jgi:hypothetical protein
MKFPALWFSQNLVHVVDSLSGVTECTKLGFKSGFYKDLLLVDSSSKKFQVVDAQSPHSDQIQLQGTLRLGQWQPAMASSTHSRAGRYQRLFRRGKESHHQLLQEGEVPLVRNERF